MSAATGERFRRRIPRATYRLQFNRDFTFRDAARLVPYLAQLGISHLYASPILKARPGSAHGYDVIDYNVLNPELGTREDLDTLAATLHAHGMGLLVDIVPNHLGVMGSDNPWWLDVLENGPAARYADYFDIDWNPGRSTLRNRLLVPVLGDMYGVILERGELKLELDRATGSFAVRYFQHLMPIDPREYPRIFAGPRPRIDDMLAPEDPNRADFESLLDAFGRLPPVSDTSAEARAERYRDKEVHKRRLVRLCERSPALSAYIAAVVTEVNGRVGDPRSFDTLHELLEAQPYRLSYWRVAMHEINFRRFFDVNDLAALRMNDAAVFEDTHQLIFALLEAGIVDGLRIDHPDGLYDPRAYFERLQAHWLRANPDAGPLYILVEKILATHERLPDEWPVNGTTGYDFANLAGAWLVHGEAEARMTRLYRAFTGRGSDFDEIAWQSKKLVMRISLAAEVSVLAAQLDRIAQLDRHTADFTRSALQDAIVETIACFPVYRTYISERGVSDEDRHIVDWAVSVARKRSPAAEQSAFDFLRAVLLGERPGVHSVMTREFAMKFQQVSAPVMAKGVEDTAFYVYNRLVCLNEVGGEPKRFGVSTSAVHQSNQERLQHWPHSMLATSTHDTKRSEDVRARIAVLSEMPDRWRRHLSRWNRLNRAKRRVLDGRRAPSRNDEYLLYQVLLGAWPLDEREAASDEFRERIQAYAIKAAREAKSETAWLNPDEEYERCLTDFVARLLEKPERNAFLHDFTKLAAQVAWFGYLNSLSQTVLKLTAPGVPDIYQGTELPVFALVDPDNRRPVDFARHAQRLAEIRDCLSAGGLEELLPRLMQHWREGLAKLYITWAVLQLRREDPELFAQGSYEALRATGARAEHLCAFVRSFENRFLLVVIPRWFARLAGGEPALPLGRGIWGDTRIEWPQAPPLARFKDALTGEAITLAVEEDQTAALFAGDVLRRLPVAVLTGR